MTIMIESDTHTAPALGRVLLIGRSGILAQAWQQALDARQLDYTQTHRPWVDLRDPSTLDAAGLEDFDTVINCAAWTDVDGAEADETGATTVNGEGVGALARRCASAGALLVHYSTDYVFDGQTTQPYATDKARAPINAYGRSKAAGERAIEQSEAPHLLIRTSWLYAPWGHNFVTTMAELVQQHESLQVVNDQRARPSSAEHVANASLALLHEKQRGTYHVTDGGEASWYDLAIAVRDALGAECRVEPCGSDAFPRPAPRPGYSTLDLTQTEAAIGSMPYWHEHVRATVSKLKVTA